MLSDVTPTEYEQRLRDALARLPELFPCGLADDLLDVSPERLARVEAVADWVKHAIELDRENDRSGYGEFLSELCSGHVEESDFVLGALLAGLKISRGREGELGCLAPSYLSVTFPWGDEQPEPGLRHQALGVSLQQDRRGY